MILLLVAANVIAALWRFGGLGRDEVPTPQQPESSEPVLEVTDEVTTAEPERAIPDKFRNIDKQLHYRITLNGDSATDSTYYMTCFVNLQWPISVAGNNNLDLLHRDIINTLFNESSNDINHVLEDCELGSSELGGLGSTSLVNRIPSDVPQRMVIRTRKLLKVHFSSERLLVMELRHYQPELPFHHGDGTIDSHIYLTYDKQHGCMLGSTGVISNMQEVLKLINQHIDKRNRSGVALSQAMRVPNFAIERNGLRFVFPKYEISGGAQGEVSVLIPYQQLRPHLKEQFIDILTYDSFLNQHNSPQ